MLSRPALARVLQSLLAAELRAARGRARPAETPGPALSAAWPDDMAMGEDAPGGLGCDSLELLGLAAAANEMFHLHEAGGEAELPGEARFGDWVDRVAAAWRAGVGTVTLTTSGSTGRPKRCPHAASDLLTEAAHLATLFGDRRRVVTLVPAHHAYGLIFAALLPDALGVPHLDAAPLGAADLARSLAPGDLVVTFPERWRWLERSLPAWPEAVEGVVSTASCPPELVEALQERGLSGMTEVYGASETAGVATRRWPEGGYALMPHWRFAAPVDPEAPEIVHRSGRRLALADRIAPAEDGRFRLAGRRDGAVQVGGINVHPEVVAARLRACPGVREAAVRLMRPEEGTRLKAFVVPEAGADPALLRDALSRFIAAALPAPERPVAVAFGTRLPAGALGKPADW